MIVLSFVSNIVDPTCFLLCAASVGRRETFSGINIVPILQELSKTRNVWHGLILSFSAVYQDSSLQYNFRHSSFNAVSS